MMILYSPQESWSAPLKMLPLNVIDEATSRRYRELVGLLITWSTIGLTFVWFFPTETKVELLSLLTFAFSKQTHI